MIYVIFNTGRKVYVDRNSVNKLNDYGTINEIVFTSDFKSLYKFFISFEDQYVPIYGLTKNMNANCFSFRTICNENLDKQIIAALKKAVK